MLSTFIFVIHSRIPYFNERTPTGYFFISLFNIALMIYCTLILTCILLLYFGFCVLLTTFTIDVKMNLIEVENKIKSGINKKGELSMNAVIEIKKDIRDLVEFHCDAKELSEK